MEAITNEPRLLALTLRSFDSVQLLRLFGIHIAYLHGFGLGGVWAVPPGRRMGGSTGTCMGGFDWEAYGRLRLGGVWAASPGRHLLRQLSRPPPPGIQTSYTNLELPPPAIRTSYTNLKLPPPGIQTSYTNLELPPPAIQTSYTSYPDLLHQLSGPPTPAI
ncbi:hypothetical protein BD626DRAFT_573613 [Schizophyllum amplum]|uniref:Uncharacterized protein n=1 Tax=Schizophyllum amplum TaxID=97359 RepID=A0A550C0S1_9AGAR|nr:hypothetical protein BD626DRAFT_573613 [Auriculariopsis ampla]